MEQIKVPFSGINRASDDGISADGACHEIINARIKNGSLEAIGNPVLVSSLPVTAQKVYYHALSGKIIVIATNGSVHALNSDYTISETLSSSLNGATRVEFLGNLCCFFVSNEIRYAIYKNGSYYYIGTKPELPTLNVTQTSKVGKVRSGTKIHIDDKNSTTVGYYDNAIYDLNNSGYYTGPILLRYALRLSNGDYICHSPIRLIYTSEQIHDKFPMDGDSEGIGFIVKERSPLFHSAESRESSNYYNFGVFGTKRTFSLSNINLDAWKDLVVSVDVFASPLQFYARSKKEGESYDMYVEKTVNKFATEATDAYMFYRVAEFSLDGTLNNSLENVSIDNLSVQTTLKDDQYSNNTYSAACSYVYNSMLHIGAVKESLFKGHKLWSDNFSATSSGTLIDAESYITINTTQGAAIVKQNIKIDSQKLSPIIGYPDSRATEIRIVYTSSGTRYSKSFVLKAHAYLNYAFVSSINDVTNERGASIGVDYGVSLSGWSTDSSTYSEQNTTITRENVLKVSSLNNPLSFPADHTYQPSTEKIIGICANTQALSQGQFGQHPLYVFCGDGVYAMSLGTSGVTYATQHPVTRDVCTNANSIRSLDKYVGFATDRGIMLLSGAEAQVISQAMDGYLPSCFNTTLLGKVMAVGSMQSKVSTVIFRDYIKGATLGYNYQENEIIIANPSYGYSYLYNLNSGQWTKLSVCIESFTNKYPECYALIDGKVHNLQNNYRSVSKIAVVSKPIKFGSNSHKRILQTALRGVIRPAESDLFLRGEAVMLRGEELLLFSDIGMYVLGSNDTHNFELAGGREKMEDIRDLITKMNKSKAYKYFALALIGGVRTDVSVNYMEYTVEESFNNRLR